MFKGFSTSNNFKTFPSLNFQVNNEAYGFSGCTLWLDAAYGLNTNTNAANVTTWQSRYGQHICTQSTVASQPIYNLTDASFNNLPSVNCNTVGKSLRFNYPITYGQKTTFVWVSKPDRQSLTETILGSDASFTILLDSGTDNPNITGPGIYSNTGSLTGTTENTNAKINVVTWYNVCVNGNIEKTGVFAGSNSPFYNLFFYSSGTYSYQGRLAELLVFDFPMTTAQMQEISSRLNLKYAIY